MPQSRFAQLVGLRCRDTDRREAPGLGVVEDQPELVTGPVRHPGAHPATHLVVGQELVGEPTARAVDDEPGAEPQRERRVAVREEGGGAPPRLVEQVELRPDVLEHADRVAGAGVRVRGRPLGGRHLLPAVTQLPGTLEPTRGDQHAPTGTEQPAATVTVDGHPDHASVLAAHELAGRGVQTGLGGVHRVEREHEPGDPRAAALQAGGVLGRAELVGGNRRAHIRHPIPDLLALDRLRVDAPTLLLAPRRAEVVGERLEPRGDAQFLLEEGDDRRPRVEESVLQIPVGSVAHHRPEVGPPLLDGVVDTVSGEDGVSRQPHRPAGVGGGSAESVGLLDQAGGQSARGRGGGTEQRGHPRSHDHHVEFRVESTVLRRHEGPSSSVSSGGTRFSALS